MVINVGLYGDGSRNSRLRAEYVSCDYAGECSTYKQGKCFNVTTPFCRRCPCGRIECIDGGTKQAQKYHQVWHSAKGNEQYGKLRYASNIRLTRIGDKAYITMPYVRIEKQNDKLFCHDPGFGGENILVDKDMLIPENVIRIVEFVPHSIMGGEISDYQNREVPFFLDELQKLFPDEYTAFFAQYPSYKRPEVNWIGRRAKLFTLNRNLEYTDYHNNVFRFEGDWLICDRYQSSFTPFTNIGDTTAIKIKVNDGMTYKITDNAQVMPDTVFVD